MDVTFLISFISCVVHRPQLPAWRRLFHIAIGSRLRYIPSRIQSAFLFQLWLSGHRRRLRPGRPCARVKCAMIWLLRETRLGGGVTIGSWTGLALCLSSLFMAEGCCYKVQNFGYTREIRIGRIGCQSSLDPGSSFGTPAAEPTHEPTPKVTPLAAQLAQPRTVSPIHEDWSPSLGDKSDSGEPSQTPTANSATVRVDSSSSAAEASRTRLKIVTPDSGSLRQASGRAKMLPPAPPPPEFRARAAGDCRPASLEAPALLPPDW
jgi:hypothetical protein